MSSIRSYLLSRPDTVLIGFMLMAQNRMTQQSDKRTQLDQASA
jgi:hypothetical protein